MNEHQRRLWVEMKRLVSEFRAGRLPFSELVDRLDGAFQAAEFKDRELTSCWYGKWMPIEIRRSVEGDHVNLASAQREVQAVEQLLAAYASNDEPDKA